MQQPPVTTEGTLRFLRVMHLVLIVSIVLYLYVMRVVPAQQSRLPGPEFFLGLCAVGATFLATGQIIRTRKVRAAFETLQIKADDFPSLAQWRMGVIVSDTLAEATAVLGMAVHMLGGTNRQVLPFLGAAILAMILWWPRRP